MDDEKTPKPLLIVGVGASAGGFEAFQRLIEHLPVESPLCLVFVLHLLPTHKSMLAELFNNMTPLPVIEAEEGMPLAAGRIYVIPPNVYMQMRDGRLQLAPRAGNGAAFLPIDRLFGSLAQEAGRRAIGVVLSGMGSDGALGLRQIKEAGGITFCQTPDSAERDEMPRAAMAAGDVDFVLSPAAIAEALIDLTHHPYVKQADAKKSVPESRPTEPQFQRIFSLLRTACGVDFTHYKRPTIERRLQRRMALRKAANVAEYLELLDEQPQEANQLFRDILIHVTFFFREPESFTALAQKAMPRLIQTRRKDEPLRIWVPGCSSGEEPYSVAITICEYLAERGEDVPVQIFATDVSETTIDAARAGLYLEAALRPVSPERLRRHFTQVDGKYRVNKQLREMCVFARHDLTRDPPFSRLDLLVCRNLLIYLDQPLQKRLFTAFHYALKPTGFLMLGSAETVGLQDELFTVVDKKHRLYGKRPGYPEPMTARVPDWRQRPRPTIAVPRKPTSEQARHRTVQQEVNQLVLDKYSPPGVLLNDRLEIVQFRGQTGYFLEPSPGEVNLHVLKMARAGLLHDLQAALAEARQSLLPVRKENVHLAFNGHGRDINLEVVPINLAGEPVHFLVLFEDMTADAEGGGPPRPRLATQPPPDVGEEAGAVSGGSMGGEAAEREARDANGELPQLQRELESTRHYLQAAIQELETANEELQSANEEVLSSNEELQSTNEELDTAKEELQSTNEELNTLNAELHSRNDELSRLNSDLVNLLSSVQMALIMVDRDLRIRRFTPTAEKLFNLIPTDVGRPMRHIKSNIVCPDLERLVKETIDKIMLVEREVSDVEGASYLLRVRPYCSLDNRIEGAVLVLMNIDFVKRKES
jgi:two-component system, chemotaxis family, CheB/CheR fusion protein